MKYDAATKDLIETDPAGWVTYLGCPVPSSAVRLVDADLATVTTDADKVLLVDAGEWSERWLLNLELQSQYSSDIERRMLQYSALLHRKHGLPVATALVLLHTKAEQKQNPYLGRLAMATPVGPAWEFRYTAIRVWERPASEFLSGPLGLLPLTPLAAVGAADLPAVVSEMKAHIDPLPERALRGKLWAATGMLMGLRFDEALINNVLEGVNEMEESVTYQALLRRGRVEGRVEGRVAMILRQGRKKFGPPSSEQEAAVVAVTDVVRLEELAERLLDANAWDELLAGG